MNLLLLGLVLVLNTLLGGVGLVTLFFRSEKTLKYISYLLMAFAAGSLVGGAVLHLIPHSLEHLDVFSSMLLLLGGFILFLLMETYLHWHRCKECELHPFTTLVLLGDAIHNIIDGLILVAMFSVNTGLGIATSIMVLAHEIPQELGIFGVQVYGGIDKTKALILSILAQATCFLGALLGFVVHAHDLAPLLIPFAAGGFIYISTSDLIPEIHKATKGRQVLGILSFLIGIGLMFLLLGH